VQEAGGRVSEMEGAAYRITNSESFLSDNGLVHAEVLEIFGEVFRGEMRYPMPELEPTSVLS
jgi:myo-inositol-1(or 4)-monophosphatase